MQRCALPPLHTHVLMQIHCLVIVPHFSCLVLAFEPCCRVRTAGCEEPGILEIVDCCKIGLKLPADYEVRCLPRDCDESSEIEWLDLLPTAEHSFLHCSQQLPVR